MDNIPHEFVTKVLTCLDIKEICRIRDRFDSPLWTAPARIQAEKRQQLKISIYPRENGIKYKIVVTREIDGEVYIDQCTFDEVLKMDLRYVRVSHFTAKLHPLHMIRDHWTTYADIPYKRLPEMIRFISFFCLDEANIALIVFQDFEKFLMNELLKNRFTTKYLHLCHSTMVEDYLKNQLQNANLTQLKLQGHWPDELLLPIEAFVCRPNFTELYMDKALFEFENLKRIFDYWLRSPWKSAEVYVHMNKNLKNEFATILAAKGDLHRRHTGELIGRKFLFEHENHYVEIDCYDWSCRMVFSTVDK